MVVLNRIYTRTGDDGTTALGTGARRPKYDLRVSAYGTVDETNSVIGLARQHTASTEPLVDEMLRRRQLRVHEDPHVAGFDARFAHDAGKETREAVVVAHRPAVERMIVALGALNLHA